MAKDKKTYFLITGATGAGKSTLIASLLPTDFEGKGPEHAVKAHGVTKECTTYPIKDTNDQCYFIDTPGMGDNIGVAKTIAKIEKQFQDITIHGIVVAIGIGTGRIDLGSQIAGDVMKLSIFDKDKDALKRVAVVGTKADKEEPEDVEFWRTNVGEQFKEILHGKPGYTVTSGVKKTAKGDEKYEDNNEELLEALKEIAVKAEALKYNMQDSNALISSLCSKYGLKTDQAELIKVLDETRKQLKMYKEEAENQRRQKWTSLFFLFLLAVILYQTLGKAWSMVIGLGLGGIWYTYFL